MTQVHVKKAVHAERNCLQSQETIIQRNSNSTPCVRAKWHEKQIPSKLPRRLQISTFFAVFTYIQPLPVCPHFEPMNISHACLTPSCHRFVISFTAKNLVRRPLNYMHHFARFFSEGGMTAFAARLMLLGPYVLMA